MSRGTTKCRSVLLAAAALVAPIHLTEVMYDAPGSDTGREWVEVTNTGADPADLFGYKVFQGGVNHALVVEQGTTTLAAGQSAVITNNTHKFLADHPSYSGTLFKSSFALTNSGDAVALKDKTLAVVDSMSYTQSAAADGNSLHYTPTGFIAGAPDPGVFTAMPPPAIIKTVPPPPPAKAPRVKKTSAKSSSTKSKSLFGSGSTSVASVAGAVQAPFDLPPAATPKNNLWTYMLGLGALVGIGVGGVLYSRSGVTAADAVTQEPQEEFELE